MNAPAKRSGIGLADLVKWLIGTLVGMSRDKGYGKIEITVQAGQIEFVHVSRSHRDSLPQAAADSTDQVKQVLAAAS